ncbi:RNA helicase [Corynebacterium sp. S7]
MTIHDSRSSTSASRPMPRKTNAPEGRELPLSVQIRAAKLIMKRDIEGKGNVKITQQIRDLAAMED